MIAAKKEDWQTKPFPELVKDLAFEREFSQAEIEQIKLGLIPKQMEDKWFIYYENETLNFHRSWTGHLIYRLTLSHSGLKNKVMQPPSTEIRHNTINKMKYTTLSS